MNSETQKASGAGRLESLDVLRGFDMFWIVGGGQIICSILGTIDGSWALALREQFQHPQWEGFRFFDLIMPLFLFMIGVAMPFSISKRLERGDSKTQIFRHVLIRVLILCFLGMLINGKLLTYDIHKFQITYSVLQVLALGYLAASIILLNMKIRWQIATTVIMLLAYWIIQTYVPAPDHRVIGNHAPGASFGDWLNEWLLGSWQGEWQRPWIVSMTTYGSTAMLGVFAGQLLRSSRNCTSKILLLVTLGVACLVVGWVWSYQLPIIKKVWTSTYVLYAGGWSYLLLAVFYLVIDVWGLRRWAVPFKVIGMNAIVAYMAWNLFSPAFGQIARVFTGGLKLYTTAPYYPSIEKTGTFLVLWLILYMMYRTRTFVKI
ncbi:MAG: hypothetical protein A2283_13115 [Lentisphaerae bacterium RIFOXYA12_FULL_48_11]|nr:MAG: hypothetical protein A2283_13115 [Lentisphaerae bacterium RIFOXYA12_FULL_48_11]